MSPKNSKTSEVDNKRQYDVYVHVPKFEICEQVLMIDESFRRERSMKLEAPYVGPYEIVRIEELNLLVRTKRSKVLKIQANRAKLFFA